VSVAGDDLVPRLSYGSMEELKGNILIVLAQEKGTVSRMFKLFAAGNALGAPRRAIAASSLPQSKRLALAHACMSCVCVCRFRQSGNEEAGEAAQVRCHTRHRRASAEAKDARTPREALAARYLRRSRAIARIARTFRTRIHFVLIVITPIFT
jgi:hypothetical protein